MKTYWRLLSFAKPLGKSVILYFFCTLLHALFNTMNFAMIIPVVNTLFDQNAMLEHVTQMPEFALNMSFFNDFVNYILYSTYGETYDVLNVLTLLAIFVAISAFLSNTFRYAGARIIEKMKIRTLLKLRNQVYDNVMGLNVGYFSNEKKGDIMAKITSDIGVVQFCITNTLQVVFKEPFLILFYVFLMLKISLSLSLFSVIYLPVVALTIGSIVKRLRRSAAEMQENFANLTSVLDESLSGVKVIKGYNAENFFVDKFSSLNHTFSKIALSMTRRQQLASPISEFLGILAAGGLLVYGGHLVITGDLNVGGFLAYIGVFTQVTRPIRSFTDAFSTINQGIAAGERVLSLLDTQSTIVEKPNAIVLEEFKNEIEFRDVRFTYETREIIKGISFKIKKGETVALVGPSGGGKSTISDLIVRFYDVDSGAILVDGIDIRDYTTHSLREHMGIVSQETVLFNETIENNIRLGNLDASLEQIEDAARVANAHDFIMETDDGFQSNIGDRGMKLSGGQRQRLSIARAVLKNPDVLILDEATSALDTESEKLVQDAINSLQAGRTSLVIAHRLSTIYSADKIIVIEDGMIVEEGTHDELLVNEGLYCKLVEMQHLA